MPRHPLGEGCNDAECSAGEPARFSDAYVIQVTRKSRGLLPLELGEAGEDGGQHPLMRGREVERQPVHCDQRHATALELLERVQQIERAAAAAR